MQNGTLNVTGNQAFADGTFTFGSGLTLNQTNDRWGISGGRTVKLMDGAKLNYTSKYNAYIGRLENGTTYNGTTQLILDNGTVDFSAATILFTPKASSSASGKNVVLNFTMINGSCLTTPNDKDMKLGAVDVANNKTHKTEKLTVAVTNSTLSVGKIIFGSSDNNLSDQDNSYINASFGPGADITCKQFYADSYPKSTIKFDGAVAHTAASVESDFFGTPSDSTFDGYELLSGGVTIDVTNSFEHGENFAPLFGVGGLTKTGSGTLTYNRDAFKFTGSLTVSNGTFVSSQQMAASAFNVDGASSILNLSNATLTNATVSLAATAGGTLTLAGATIPNDEAPNLMLAGGGTTDYFTRDSAVGTYTLDSLTLGEGVTLSLTGGDLGVDEVSVNTLVLSATTANKVALNFSDAANIAPGTYNILAITGGGSFAAGDEAKFALDANAPEGAALSVSEASLVLTVPATNPATWTGGANDGKFSTPGNWLGGAVPGVSDDVVISVASETTLDCDVALNVNSITFPATSAKVTIEGAGCITNATTIVNYSAARPVIDVPVEFVSGDAYAQINVTGEVDFQGGVKGTLPANHSKFYGNYTLTANEWTLTSAITLAENATVTASDLEITISTQDSKYLCAEAGASLCLKKNQDNPKGRHFRNLFWRFASQEHYDRYWRVE